MSLQIKRRDAQFFNSGRVTPPTPTMDTVTWGDDLGETNAVINMTSKLTERKSISQQQRRKNSIVSQPKVLDAVKINQ
jgi:hypothetical protein